MKMSNENTQIIKALLHVQEEIQNPKKTEENPYYKSKYAPLDQILNEVRVLLSKHGLVMIQDTGGDDEGNVVVSTTLLHESGGWIQTSPRSETTARKASATPQEMGSAITYARRYQLMSLLGIAGKMRMMMVRGPATQGHCSRSREGRPHRPSPTSTPAPNLHRGNMGCETKGAQT